MQIGRLGFDRLAIVDVGIAVAAYLYGEVAISYLFAGLAIATLAHTSGVRHRSAAVLTAAGTCVSLTNPTIKRG